MDEDAPSPAPSYPRQVRLRDGTQIWVRPIGPEDAEREQAFVRGLSPESRYLRFLNTLLELSPEMLQKSTHPDPAREIALVALAGEAPQVQQVGVARWVRSAEGSAAEFAIVVADAWQGKGLGSLLMQALIDAARAAGLKRLEGWVLATNHAMLNLMQALQFDIRTAPEDARMRYVVKSL